ncbi:hypothetical protein GQF42_34305 [Streptomyces broussonetiae]|uniref:UL36 very large tegument protein n=1 Tax=Streptomyces broussonetiae TaxID=2686304 RepID=A0A6I6NLR7_9ACTN|nr:hypothetical protein GQF42_34305 [Streptomyces broussonetiae]
MDQLPGRVREFAGYLDGLLARLDHEEGWSGVFWRRDPEGMRACLAGHEVPPWDVVLALLEDVAAVYGTAASTAERARAGVLYRAALDECDARPGAREALADRLDVMLREQRYAVERQAGLSRLLSAPPTGEAPDSLRLDLAWARDDHARAVARCAELRSRLAELDRRAARASGLDLGSPPGGQASAPGSDLGSQSGGRASAPGPDLGSQSGQASVLRPGFGSQSDGAPAPRPDLGSQSGGQASAPGPDLGSQPGQASVLRPGLGSQPGRAPAPRPDLGPQPRQAPAPRTGLAVSAASRIPSVLDAVDPEAPVSDPATSASSTPQSPAPTAAPAQPRRRRRGSARFAGMGEGGDEPVAVPQSAVAGSPRGARFAGGAERVAEVAPAESEEPDAEAGAAVAGAVGRLARLRADGRSGEAHVLLVEVAQWSAARFPLLADALHRAGLGADWTTLLWEAASLPAERLVGVAERLTGAGRDVDGRQLLRQGVARPAEQVGAAVLRLEDAGRRREARALLDACVRVRTPEEAARAVGPEPGRLVPLLLEAARAVSAERYWDLVHALRVAGHAA